jgi:hypothetical protein
LNASLEATALMRRVQSEGGSATLLRRGDFERGSLMLIVTSRSRHICCLQRQLNLSSGNYSWNQFGPSENADSQEVARFLLDQARFDPDLWQIELDVPSPERFIAETNIAG